MTFPNKVLKASRAVRGGRNASSTARPIKIGRRRRCAGEEPGASTPSASRPSVRNARCCPTARARLAEIPLDLPTISERLAASMPAAAGLTDKSFANIKSSFLAAVRTSGLKALEASPKIPMSPSWRKLMAQLSSKRRMRLGLSRLARWCSGMGIEPAELSNSVLAEFICAVRAGTLHRKPNELHRNVAQNLE